MRCGLEFLTVMELDDNTADIIACEEIFDGMLDDVLGRGTRIGIGT